MLKTCDDDRSDRGKHQHIISGSELIRLGFENIWTRREIVPLFTSH